MVDKQHSTEQWKISCVETTPVVNKIRCLKGRMGAYCQGMRTGGPWSDKERDLHINILELKAAKFSILTYTQNKSYLNSIHIQMDNMTVLSYLVKMEGTNNQELVKLSKQIWNHLISMGITLTTEHLPGVLNIEADFESRNVRDCSDRQSDISKTQPSIRDSRDRPFCLKGVETTKEILFLENRSIQSGQGCISGQLVPGFELCLSSIQSDRTSTKVQRERATLIFITPAWQTQSCLQKLMEMVISTPVLLPSYENLLSNPKRGDSPTLIKPILKAIGMESFRKKLSSEGISERASNLISNARRMGTNCNYE